MASKQQKQIFDLVMALENKPSNLNRAGIYIDSYIMNWNFETQTVAEHAVTQNQLSAMLQKYREIRGR